MARILFLSQLVPFPPDAGPKVRSYYTLRYLAQQHEVTLLAFSRPDDQPEALEHLRTFLPAVYTFAIKRSPQQNLLAMLASLAGGEPFVIRRDRVAEMTRKILFELQSSSYDFIHVDQLWMAQYALGINPPDHKSRLKVVLDAHNATYQIFQRLAQRELNPLKRLVLEREWRLLRRYEAQVCRQVDHLVTVTPEDLMTLQGLIQPPNRPAPDRQPTMQVIPICIDVQKLTPVVARPGSHNILHLGTMFWAPNVEGIEWFLRKVWPIIKTQAPEATLTVVGKRPPKSLLHLAKRDRSVQVTGYVPDPQPHLEACRAFIVPLHAGSGMRVKIVESWGRGLPIVSTTIGAEGLDYHNGENILIADEPGAFAAAVVRLLTDEALNLSLRENGRAWVESHYDWRSVYTAFDQIYAPVRR